MKMKKFVLRSFLLATLGCVAFASMAQAEERVVATVDGIPVLESQVRANMGKKGDRQSAIDKIIDDILVQKAIQESGVKIDPREIDHIVEDTAARNGLTYGQFLDALDYQGISLNTFRQQIANQMMMGAVRNKAIQESIDVTREEVVALGQKNVRRSERKGYGTKSYR